MTLNAQVVLPRIKQTIKRVEDAETIFNVLNEMTGGAGSAVVFGNGVTVTTGGLTVTAGGATITAGGLDINGTALVLDADGDTSITADTDDQIDFAVAGADDFQMTANTFTALAGSTIAGADADSVTVNSVIVPQELEVPFSVGSADATLFVATQAYEVTKVSCTFATAEVTTTDLTMQLTKDTGTDAPGAGTDLLTNNTNAGFDMTATANTVQTGTLTATTSSLQLAAGDRLAIDLSGAVNELAGAVITVSLKRI